MSFKGGWAREFDLGHGPLLASALAPLRDAVAEFSADRVFEDKISVLASSSM